MTSRRMLRACTHPTIAVMLVLMGLIPTVGSAAAVPPRSPVAGPVPVSYLDLNRYLGTWNQLAAVPQYFNLVCARDTQATYARDPQGNIAVHNSCITWANTVNEIDGTAVVNDRQTGAQLHVSFPSVPTQEGVEGPTNYIVTALGPDYSWAIVTDPTRVTGFVLARAARLDADGWQQVRAEIAAAGQNACLYLTSPTTGGETRILPLCLL
ncbi:lipocalin family protein [Nocardia sp. CNY236]|uniref:lipocalin family protein n=1 Tax=Nocardia sp. CNY236 TaxID=1169152 RepID=UPI0003F59121|nr:lipocalin family protein [Nocardia sp. CNY236]